MRSQDLLHSQCQGTVPEICDILRTCLENKGLHLFLEFDHSRNAQEAGLALPSCTVLQFGHPTVNTLLMQVAPSMALDLPVKLLVWEDAEGQCWLSCHDIQQVARMHGLPEEHPIIGKLATLMNELIRKVSLPSA